MTNENDPLDHLGEAFRQEPAPDQWNEIVARSEGPVTAAPRAASTGGRHTWWWLGAAAAAVVALVGGVALIRERDTNPPVATQPGEAVPAPSTALPCANESDLAVVVELLGSGTENLDYGQHGALHLLGSDAHAVLAADVASVARADGWRRLELSGTPTYFTGEGPVDAISERAPWDAAIGADPLAAPLPLDNVRVVAAVRSLSSAPVWSPGLGELIVGCAGVDVPAIDMHNGSTLFGDPSIDEIAELMADPEAAPPVPSAPPTAPLSTVPTNNAPASIACTGDVDLDAIVNLLRAGLGGRDYERAATLEELAGRNELVIRANVTEVWRDPDDDPDDEDLGRNVFTGVRVANVELLTGAQVAVEAFGFGSSWADGQGPDPLAVPVTITDTVVVAFLEPFDHAPGGWSVDPEGLFVSCPNGINARAVLGNIDFLDYSSPLHHFADQIRALGMPEVPSPWVSPCVERLADGSVAPDPATWSAFGPLGAEPGLQLRLPAQNVPEGYSAGTTFVGRLPGGVHVTSRAPDGSESIVVAVNHDGTVRWRRCISGYVEVHASSDASVGLLSIWIPADIGGVQAWELIDLETGTSSPAPSELEGRSLDVPLGGFAVFSSTDDTIAESSRLAVVDLNTMTVNLVPYPDTWFGTPPGHFIASPYEIDGEVVLIRWWDTGGPSVVYVDGVWTEYAAAAGPTADALRSFLRERVTLSFRNNETDQTHLTAYSGENEVVWERTDLLPVGGEGFQASPRIGAADDAVFVVRACREPSGFPFDCGVQLVGISAVDGRTLWQIDEARGVPIVADGYAVVAGDAGYQLIDVRSGRQVPGTATWDHTVFASECCGLGDYFYVGHAGALAWSVSADYSNVGAGPHVNIWYPAGTREGTVTVDLLAG